ncbi:MAG: GT2 family glycosyltransferase [Planctomycetota bacterium]|jgi:GT2 family glycosyltransferase
MDVATRSVGPVSAVICNYNGEGYLAACLDALAAQTLAPAEIIVVDNESTDGSLALLEERYPHVKIVRMGSNGGPAPARNAGMRAAQYPWVLALDNDAYLSPHGLEYMVRAAEEHADAVLVQPRSVFSAEPERVHYDGGQLHYAGLLALRNFYTPLAEAQGEGVVAVDGAVSLCLLVNAEIVLAAGGYDERYFILFEDLDLSYRLRSEGHGIYSVESVLCVHDEGTPGISFREGPRYPARRVRFHSRNRWMYMAKCYSLWTLILAAPGLLLYEGVQLLFAVQQRGLSAYLLGKWDVLCGLPEALRLRRATQARRKVGDGTLLVPGPLTLTPAVAESNAKALIARNLNSLLSFWWNLVRPLAGR